MKNFSLPTKAEVQTRAGTKGSGMGGGVPWLGWAGIALQALGANSQDMAEKQALEEQKRQATMQQALQSRDRRDVLQQQGIQNFDAERGRNMQGIGMLADMRNNQSGNRQYSAFRKDFRSALQAVGGGM
jgi:hypothetical protein